MPEKPKPPLMPEDVKRIDEVCRTIGSRVVAVVLPGEKVPTTIETKH